MNLYSPSFLTEGGRTRSLMDTFLVVNRYYTISFYDLIKLLKEENTISFSYCFDIEKVTLYYIDPDCYTWREIESYRQSDKKVLLLPKVTVLEHESKNSLSVKEVLLD